jgi:hypothetical protein
LPGKRQAGWPFSLVIFLFTPGILPYALRASFAVRACILRARGHPKRKWLGRRRQTKALALKYRRTEQRHRARARSYKARIVLCGG